MASLSQETEVNNASGTADVTVLAAPASSTTRMIPENGITIYNNTGASATITIQKALAASDKIKENFVLASKDTWTNAWVTNLDLATSTLQVFVDSTISSGTLDIDVSYRDEAQ
jgi:hypothetical protein